MNLGGINMKNILSVEKIEKYYEKGNTYYNDVEKSIYQEEEK